MALKSLILLIVLILSPLNAFEADFLYADSDAPLIAQNTLNLSLKKKLRAPQKPPRKRTTRVIKARKKFPKQPASSSSIKAQNEFQLGQEMSVLYKKKNLNNRIVSNIDFFIYKNSGSIELKTPTDLLLNYSASAQAKIGTTNNVDVRSLYLNYSGDILNLTIGFQEIPWGETFGFQIADIINPKDFSNPMEPERIPVFTVNSQIYINNLTIQTILTPFPRNNKLPSVDSPFNPFPETAGVNVSTKYSSMKVSLEDFEYGGKIGLLFDGGLDTSLFYLNHWNRNLLVESKIENFQMYITPVKKKVHTLGGSFSYSLSKIVFRSDYVYHVKAPFPTEEFGDFELTTYHESILGVDLTLESGWIFGLQGHYNKYDDFSLSWGGMNIRKDFLNGKLKIDLMGIKGINNKDIWIKPEATWVIANFIHLKAHFDILSGAKEQSVKKGILPFYKDMDRFFIKLTAMF